MKVVVINGRERSGKDLFAYKCLIVNNGKVMTTSMVDGVKGIAQEIGWTGSKEPRDRKFLSDLKDLLDEYNDYSFKYVEESIDGLCKIFPKNFLKDYIVFIMARQPEDIERLVKKYNAKTVLIRRAAAEEAEPSNHADANVFNYNYDYEIINNGTLIELVERAKDFVEEILENGIDY